MPVISNKIALSMLMNRVNDILVTREGDNYSADLYHKMYAFKLASGIWDEPEANFDPDEVVMRDICLQDTIVLGDDDEDYNALVELYDAGKYDISNCPMPSGYKHYHLLEVLDKDTMRALVRIKG